MRKKGEIRTSYLIGGLIAFFILAITFLGAAPEILRVQDSFGNLVFDFGGDKDVKKIEGAEQLRYNFLEGGIEYYDDGDLKWVVLKNDRDIVFGEKKFNGGRVSGELDEIYYNRELPKLDKFVVEKFERGPERLARTGTFYKIVRSSVVSGAVEGFLNTPAIDKGYTSVGDKVVLDYWSVAQLYEVSKSFFTNFFNFSPESREKSEGIGTPSEVSKEVEELGSNEVKGFVEFNKNGIEEYILNYDDDLYVREQNYGVSSYVLVGRDGSFSFNGKKEYSFVVNYPDMNQLEAEVISHLNLIDEKEFVKKGALRIELGDELKDEGYDLDSGSYEDKGGFRYINYRFTKDSIPIDVYFVGKFAIEGNDKGVGFEDGFIFVESVIKGEGYFVIDSGGIDRDRILREGVEVILDWRDDFEEPRVLHYSKENKDDYNEKVKVCVRKVDKKYLFVDLKKDVGSGKCLV
jgi:hypothetical protein